MSGTPKPGNQEFTIEGACTECMRMGWAVFNDKEVQRCDNCAVFPTDEAALAHAVRLGAQVLREVASQDSPRRRTGRRFKEILLAMEIAAEQICPTPWIADPTPEWLRMTVRHMERVRHGEVTLLAIAYEMQDQGLFRAPHAGMGDFEEEEIAADREYVRRNLDRDRLESLLRQAGCESFERWQGHTFWRVSKKAA